MVGCVRHVQNLHAACAIHAQGVVHRIGTSYLQFSRLARFHDSAVAEVRAVVRAVAECVNLAGGYPERIRRVRVCPGHIEVNVVRGKAARAVLRIEQGEAVSDEIGQERLVVALQGIDERPLLAVGVHHSRADVFQVAALVVGPVAPVAHLLHGEHGQHALWCHLRAVVGCTAFQVVAEVGQYEVPKPALPALEGVLACLRVPCVPVEGVVVGKEAVVALAVLRVAVVIGDVPQLAVPCAQQHVLGTLVHTGMVVGMDIIGKQEVLVKVLFYF